MGEWKLRKPRVGQAEFGQIADRAYSLSPEHLTDGQTASEGPKPKVMLPLDPVRYGDGAP